MNEKALSDKLDAMTAQADKISVEQQKRFDEVTAEVAALRAQIDAGEVTPVLQASADRLQAKLDALDATIPDAPAPTPP